MGRGVPQVDAYSFWQAQVDRLGDRDPMQVLESTADALTARLEEHGPAAFAAHPFEGKWTPGEIIGHLIDVEFIFGFRVRTTVADKNPSFGGVDQDAWVAAQGYADREASTMIEQFRSARSVNLAFWRGLTAEDLERTGLHEQAGVELSLAQMRNILAGHDLYHGDQLNRYLQAVGQ